MREARVEIDAAVDRSQKAKPLTGTVLVESGGKPVFEKAYGLANRSDSIPNTPSTRYQIASGCKIFTAVEVCRLVERGLLGFETPLGECLDLRFPHFDPAITIHHLLTHTSGIADYFDEESGAEYEALWKDVPMYRVFGPGDFLSFFQNEPMRSKPGERFFYNNAGFIVLGLVVEHLTGEAFSNRIETDLFEPCGMSDSGYFRLDRLPGNTAHAYIEDAETATWRTNTYAVPIVGGPDGGAYTTARDMSRFWNCLFSHRLLDEETTARLLKAYTATATANEPPSTHYGYGVWIVERDGTAAAHYVCGWDPGVSFLSVAHRRGEAVITILANANRVLYPIHDAIAETLGL